MDFEIKGNNKLIKRRFLSGYGQYTGKILAIAIPIMLSNLISQLQMLIDRVFIGGISLNHMSAVSNASTPIWTTMSFLFSLTTGATILVSQAYGEGNHKRAKEVLSSVFKFNNVIGIAMFLFWFLCPKYVFTLTKVDKSIIGMSVDYARYYAPIFILTGIGASISCLLQVSQKTKIMIWYGLIRSLSNIFLDYVMIFGHFGFPAMGVKGAALATTIAELLGDVVVLVYVLVSKELVLKPSYTQIIKAKFSKYVESIKLGSIAACEDFAWNMGNMYLIVMLNKVSVDAAGIHSIIFGVELVTVVLMASIGSATLTLSGYEKGRKNQKGVWNVVIDSFLIGLAIAVVNLILFMVIPKQIIGIFTKDQAVIMAAPIYLLIVGLDLFPKGGNMIVGSGIKGYGEPSWMLKTQLFGTAFVVITSTILVLVFHMGIMALFIMVVADESIRFVLNYRKLCRIRREN